MYKDKDVGLIFKKDKYKQRRMFKQEHLIVLFDLFCRNLIILFDATFGLNQVVDDTIFDYEDDAETELDTIVCTRCLRGKHGSHFFLHNSEEKK